jgi:hypothetical protein
VVTFVQIFYFENIPFLSTTENTVYPNGFKGYVFLWYMLYRRAVAIHPYNVTMVTFPNYCTSTEANDGTVPAKIAVLVQVPVLNQII